MGISQSLVQTGTLGASVHGTGASEAVSAREQAAATGFFASPEGGMIQFKNYMIGLSQRKSAGLNFGRLSNGKNSLGLEARQGIFRIW